MSETESLSFDAGGGTVVSALLDRPPKARALLVLAHGAGAGMRHPFLTAMARALADQGIATLRYQFPYMEAGRRSVDKPPVAHAAVRAAVAESARRTRLPLFAGGKSYGGRMSSQTAAEGQLPVHGLVFLGFPLHPPGRPEAAADRSAHLAEVTLPMLFLQGTRDEFANLDLLESLVKRLRKTAELHLIEGANHSFKLSAGSGRQDGEVRAELAAVTAAWMDKTLAKPAKPGKTHR